MDSSDEDDDIWDYKSHSRYRPSQVSRSFHTQPAAGGRKSSTKFSTQAQKPATKSRKSTVVKEEPGKHSKNEEAAKKTSDTTSSASKQKQSKKKQTRVRKSSGAMETPVKREGRCPICQLPFSALSSIETPSWHMDQCQMSTSKAKEECAAGLSCESLIESHYRRFRHTEIARSNKKKSQQSQQQFGNIDGAKTCLSFDGAGPSHSGVVEEEGGATIVISSCSEDEKQAETNSRMAASDNLEHESDNMVVDLDNLVSDIEGDDTSAVNETLVDDCDNDDDNFGIDFDNLVSDDEAEETAGPTDRTPVADRGRESSNELPDIGHDKDDSDVVAYKESFENLVQASLTDSVKDIDASCEYDTRNVSDMLHDILDDDSPAVRDDVGQSNKTNVFEDIFSSDSEGGMSDNEEKGEDAGRKSESKQVKGGVKASGGKSVYLVDTDLDKPDSEIDEELGKADSDSDFIADSDSSESLLDLRGSCRTVKRLASSDDSSLSTDHLTLNFSQTRSANKKQKMESGKDSPDGAFVKKEPCSKQRVTRSSMSFAGKANDSRQPNRTSPRKLTQKSNKMATQSDKIDVATQKITESKKTTTGKSTQLKKSTPQKITQSGKTSLPKTTQSNKSVLPKIKQEKVAGKIQTSVTSFFLPKAEKTNKEIVIRTDSESEDDGCHGNHTKPGCCIQCSVASTASDSRAKQTKQERIRSTLTTGCISTKQIKQEQISGAEKGNYNGAEKGNHRVGPKGDHPCGSLSLQSLCTPHDANYVESRNERSRTQNRDVTDTVQEDGYNEMSLNGDCDMLAGGFFHDGEMDDHEFSDHAEAETDKFASDVTGDSISPSQVLNPPDSCSVECNQSTIAFVQTVTDKVSQITKNASDILMASSRLLSKKDSQKLPGSDLKSKGRWGSGVNRGRNTPGPSRGATGGGAEEGASQGAGDAKRSCPFYKKIPDTCFTMDAFRYGDIPGCRAYILSHFHYDHYGGLTKKFAKPIYCSQITANLVRRKIGVDAQYLNPVSLDTPTMIEGVEVTLIEANHCPGAVLILFRLRGGRLLLHTGDFRASPDMERHPALRNTRIHTLYLDTTYCDPQYAFPPQEEAIACAVRLVEEARAKHPKTLIVCATYTIGKERIFAAIARALNCKICVTREKKTVLDCLEDQELSQRLSLNWQDSGLHVLPMNKLKLKDLQEHLVKNGRKFDRVLAIEPTGWTHNGKLASLDQIQPKVNRDNVTVYGIPYSEHSSYLELKRFVQFTRPTKILPTVNNGNVHSRRRMEVIFEAWTEEAARRT